MKKRLFIAINLPDHLREVLADYHKGVKRKEIRWAPWENLHITVYFLGYISEELIPKLVESLQRACTGIKPFELVFQEICFAPPHSTPRMVWARFASSSPFTAFSAKIKETVKDIEGMHQEERAPLPHVTLARFEGAHIAKNVALKQPHLDDSSFEVRSCELMESHLSRSGPTYATIVHFPFQVLQLNS